jgi:hypothetical protein
MYIQIHFKVTLDGVIKIYSNSLEDQDVDGWTILKWILERQDGMVGIGSIWLRIGTDGGLM